MEAARSRKLVAQTRQSMRGAVTSEEEARAYLQRRLTLFAKLMFWSFVTLLIFLAGVYRLYEEIAPRHEDIVFGGAAALLVVMAGIWRGALVRRTLSVAALYRIDLLFQGGIGAAFAGSATLAYDFRPAGYASLIYALFTVFARAILIPSSGPRTAVASSLTFAPMIAGAVYLATTTAQELPPVAYLGGAIVFAAVAVIIATVGSQIIYGLRRQVSQAKQLGQYALEGKIGEGGMGAVYRARHALLRRPTAVKLLQPDRVGADNLDRFEREVQHMSQLTHPNTVAVYDYGRNPDGVLYYAMEYLDGIDLEQLVRRHGPQPGGRVSAILRQVCGALAEAHARGLIHRDIKPANIILCERGGLPDFAKVVDFGLVKDFARDSPISTKIILGTPAYLSPEAITDPEAVGPAADLYALGAVGYFLLTGRRVFDGRTSLEISIQHVTATPRPPSELAAGRVSPELEAVILRCLAKAPAERYASAEALADALAALPPLGDWTRDDALAWWREFRRTEAEAPRGDVDAATVTLTLDVAQRPPTAA